MVEPPPSQPTPYVITVSSDEDEDEEDEVQMLEFHKNTQSLIDEPAPKVVKKLSEAECPICFDSIENATTTSCGHLFCLNCLQRSISASAARGQTRRKGGGLCPMCRKTVLFKDTIVLKFKKQIPYNPFEQEEPQPNAGTDHTSCENDQPSAANAGNSSDNDSEFLDEEIEGLF